MSIMSTSEYLKKKIKTLIPSIKNGMIPITIEIVFSNNTASVRMKDLSGIVVSERILKMTKKDTLSLSGIFLKLEIDGD